MVYFFSPPKHELKEKIILSKMSTNTSIYAEISLHGDSMSSSGPLPDSQEFEGVLCSILAVPRTCGQRPQTLHLEPVGAFWFGGGEVTAPNAPSTTFHCQLGFPHLSLPYFVPCQPCLVGLQILQLLVSLELKVPRIQALFGCAPQCMLPDQHLKSEFLMEAPSSVCQWYIPWRGLIFHDTACTCSSSRSLSLLFSACLALWMYLAVADLLVSLPLFSLASYL